MQSLTFLSRNQNLYFFIMQCFSITVRKSEPLFIYAKINIPFTSEPVALKKGLVYKHQPAPYGNMPCSACVFALSKTRLHTTIYHGQEALERRVDLFPVVTADPDG
jgi:hypothetical protein